MKNFFTWLGHGLVMSLILVLPILFKIHPAWLDVTIGGLLNSFYIFLASKWGTNNPSTLGFTFRRRY